LSLVANVSAPEFSFALAAYPAWARQASQAVTYPRMFAEVAQQQGVARAQILRHAGLPVDALENPSSRLSLLDTLRVLRAVHALSGDMTTGFQAGLRLPLTAHGSLGYAVMCAATPREVTELLQRFWHLRGRGVLLMMTELEQGLLFELIPELPLPAELRDLLFSSTLASMASGMGFVMPTVAVQREIWMQGPEPAGFDAWRGSLPSVRFDMPRSGLAVLGARAWLDEPLPTANPEALAQAIAHCERESALQDAGDDVVRQTRAAITLGGEGYPSPQQLAEALHLTTRTFRRRLQEQGHSYKSLLEEARRRDSCQLLANPDLEIQRVGELLGYREPANFTRAFKLWTGLTPSEWRLRHRRA